MLNKKAEESYSPPGLFSQVRYLPDEPHADGEFVFEVSVNGEGYGGPMAVKKVVPQYDLTDPRWAASPFLFARMDVLSRVSRRMAEERKARDEEE